MTFSPGNTKNSITPQQRPVSAGLIPGNVLPEDESIDHVRNGMDFFNTSVFMMYRYLAENAPHQHSCKQDQDCQKSDPYRRGSDAYIVVERLRAGDFVQVLFLKMLLFDSLSSISNPSQIVLYKSEKSCTDLFSLIPAQKVYYSIPAGAVFIRHPQNMPHIQRDAFLT